MTGIKIIDVKVVGVCSKHRKETDEVPRYKDGSIIEDKDVSCIYDAFADKEEQEESKERTTLCPAVLKLLNNPEYLPNENIYHKGLEYGATLQAEWERERVKELLKEWKDNANSTDAFALMTWLKLKIGLEPFGIEQEEKEK